MCQRGGRSVHDARAPTKPCACNARSVTCVALTVVYRGTSLIRNSPLRTQPVWSVTTHALLPVIFLVSMYAGSIHPALTELRTFNPRSITCYTICNHTRFLASRLLFTHAFSPTFFLVSMYAGRAWYSLHHNISPPFGRWRRECVSV